MAKTTAPARSESIDVAGLDARALAAAWRGVYHFLGGRVDNWEVITPNEDNPDGGLVAHGFTVDADLDPNKVIADIGNKERRLEFFPFYSYLNGAEPPHFDKPQDMTNFMIQYLKGSVEEGTSKTPEYVRTKVAAYKAAHNMRTRRGPKRKIIRLDELANIDASQLSSIDPDELAAFLALAQSVQAANATSNTPIEAVEVATGS